MTSPDSIDRRDIQRLRFFLYLIPVFGFFPALWTLYRTEGSKKEKQTSRLAVTLAMTWLLGTILLQGGGQLSEGLALPLLLTSSFWTSGYFVLNLWLMMQVWRRKPLRLPVIGKVSDRLR